MWFGINWFRKSSGLMRRMMISENQWATSHKTHV